VQSDSTTTWLGMLGTGVDQTGIDGETWSDHTDIRPRMLELLGLADDYGHDGRALNENLAGWAIPAAAKQSSGFVPLAQMYKRINAIVGELGLASLKISTNALTSDSSNDGTYSDLENQLISITGERDALAAQMIALLEGAAFNGKPIDGHQAQQLVSQGQALLDRVNALAGP